MRKGRGGFHHRCVCMIKVWIPVRARSREIDRNCTPQKHVLLKLSKSPGWIWPLQSDTFISTELLSILLLSIKIGRQPGRPGSATRDGLHLSTQLLCTVANEWRSHDQQHTDAAPLPLTERNPAYLCFTSPNTDNKDTKRRCDVKQNLPVLSQQKWTQRRTFQMKE